MLNLYSTHGALKSLPSHETTKHPNCRDVSIVCCDSFQCQNEHVFLSMFWDTTFRRTDLEQCWTASHFGFREPWPKRRGGPDLSCSTLSRFPSFSQTKFRRFPIQSELDSIREVISCNNSHPTSSFPKMVWNFGQMDLMLMLMFVCVAVSRQNSCLAAFCVCQKDRSTCCLPCAAVVRGLLLSWCGREEGEIHSFGTNLKHLYWLGIFVTRMYRYLEGGHAVLTFACWSLPPT